MVPPTPDLALAKMPGPPSTLELPELEEPGLPVIGGAIPRVRNALGEVAGVARQRMTLVIILIVVLVLSAGVFAYLILRRR